MPSQFEQLVENATSDKSSEDDWALIMEICDRVTAHKDGPRDVIKAIVKRANHRNHTVAAKSLTLMDACVNNCGRKFASEMASRDSVQEFRKIANSSGKTAEKMRSYIKKWAENDLKSESAIVQLNNELKSGSTVYSTVSFADDAKPRSASKSSKPTAQELQEKEIEDLARAMALSMQEAQAKQHNLAVPPTQTPQNTPAGSSSNLSSLYPTMGVGAPQQVTAGGSNSVTSTLNSNEPRKVRALYDFEAAEENELTFKTGDVIFVLDDSDANWWRGFTQSTPPSALSEGLLFPSNFVTSDLTYQPAPENVSSKKDQQATSATSGSTVTTQPAPVDQAQVVIDEAKIDRGLSLIQAADPTGEQRPDTDELLRIEQECRFMGPLVDTELEQIDALHAKLTDVNQALVDAFAEYHRQMAQEVNDKRTQLMQQTLPPQYGGPQPQYYDPSTAPNFIPSYGVPLAGAPGAITYGPPTYIGQPSPMPPPPQQQPNGYGSSPVGLPQQTNGGYALHQPPQPMNLQQMHQTMVFGGGYAVPQPGMMVPPTQQQGPPQPQFQQQMPGQV